MVFIPYHENELLDLDETSNIEVLHFADEMVFSSLLNKQHLWFGYKMYYFITLSNIPIFHLMFCYCAVAEYSAVSAMLLF